MQLNISPVKQNNPTFGYFNISEQAQKYITGKLKANQAEKFAKILEQEAKNDIVEASVDCYNNVLMGFLCVYDKDKKPIYEFYRDLGHQGRLSRCFKGPLSYLEKVSKESSDLLLEYNIAARIEDAINKRNFPVAKK